MKPWERQEDTEVFEWLKKQMVECFETAVNWMNCKDPREASREYANYYQGMGNGFKMILEKFYDFKPEQEMDIDDLLCILDEL